MKRIYKAILASIFSIYFLACSSNNDSLTDTKKHNTSDSIQISTKLTTKIKKNVTGVLEIDRKLFADLLNINRSDPKIGGLPLDPRRITAQKGNITYSGVYAVSYSIMSEAYPNSTMYERQSYFDEMDNNKTIFDKFIFEIFSSCSGNKDIIRLLYLLCYDLKLANRIYSSFKIEYNNTKLKTKAI